jgi:hypothetical protein
MGRHRVVILFAFVLSFQGCVRFHPDSQLRSIDRVKARSMSDEFIEDVKQKKISIVYSKMQRAFRDATSRDDFETALGRLFDQYGVPLFYGYDRETESVEVLATGEMRRLLKLYYAVETTKYGKGSYYLSVDIVSEGDGLAVSGLYFNKLL